MSKIACTCNLKIIFLTNKAYKNFINTLYYNIQQYNTYNVGVHVTWYILKYVLSSTGIYIQQEAHGSYCSLKKSLKW